MHNGNKEKSALAKQKQFKRINKKLFKKKKKDLTISMIIGIYS